MECVDPHLNRDGTAIEMGHPGVESVDRWSGSGQNGSMIFFLLLPLLVGGLAVYVICVAIPWLQKYALSAALWFLALLPGLLLWLLIGVGALVGQDAVGRGMYSPRWEMSFWHVFGSPAARVTLTAIGITGIVVMATIIAVVHQFVIHRLTFALFRLYAGFVTGSVAVLSGSLVGAVVATYLEAPWEVAFVVVTTLVAALGWAGARLGIRIARRLRGRAPERYTWVTEAEYYGVVVAGVK